MMPATKLPGDEPWQLTDRDVVALLFGTYDPPNMSYLRAIETLLSDGRTKQVWLCPLVVPERSSVAYDMSMLLEIEANRSIKGKTGCCLAKKQSIPDLLEWCKKHYPMLHFTTAKLQGFPGDVDLEIAFSGQKPSQNRSILLNKYLPIDEKETRNRIMAGIDESRNFPLSIWEYIQKNKLYRKGLYG
jgi:nicotinic acid mononucleotide adenylyltransferase